MHHHTPRRRRCTTFQIRIFRKSECGARVCLRGPKFCGLSGFCGLSFVRVYCIFEGGTTEQNCRKYWCENNIRSKTFHNIPKSHKTTQIISLKIQMSVNLSTLLPIIRGEFGQLKMPVASDKVHKDECMASFDRYSMHYYHAPHIYAHICMQMYRMCAV